MPDIAGLNDSSFRTNQTIFDLESIPPTLLIVGGGGWNARACANLAVFVEAFGLPVVSGFRRQDIFDNRHPHYAGHAGLGPSAKLVERIRSADLIVAVGGRLGETTTSGYTLFNVPQPLQRFVHVHADPDELGRVYQADLMINAGMQEFAAAAAAVRPRPSSKPDAEAARKAWIRAAREEFFADQTPGSMPGLMDLGAVVMHLRGVLPSVAIGCGDGLPVH